MVIEANIFRWFPKSYVAVFAIILTTIVPNHAVAGTIVIRDVGEFLLDFSTPDDYTFLNVGSVIVTESAFVNTVTFVYSPVRIQGGIIGKIFSQSDTSISVEGGIVGEMRTGELSRVSVSNGAVGSLVMGLEGNRFYQTGGSVGQARISGGGAISGGVLGNLTYRAGNFDIFGAAVVGEIVGGLDLWSGLRISDGSVGKISGFEFGRIEISGGSIGDLSMLHPNADVRIVPEPSTVSLMLFGLLGLIVSTRVHRQRKLDSLPSDLRDTSAHLG